MKLNVKIIKDYMINYTRLNICTLWRVKIRTILPLDYKSKVGSNHLHFASGILIISKETNSLNTSICFSSLVDIIRSIDTFTMLCGYLINPFVVTTFINPKLPRFKPSPLSKAYKIKKIFKINKEK